MGPYCVKQLAMGRKDGPGTCLNQSPATELGGALSEVDLDALGPLISAMLQNTKANLLNAKLARAACPRFSATNAPTITLLAGDTGFW